MNIVWSFGHEYCFVHLTKFYSSSGVLLKYYYMPAALLKSLSVFLNSFKKFKIGEGTKNVFTIFFNRINFSQQSDGCGVRSLVL